MPNGIRIEDVVRRELARSDPRDPLRGLEISGKLMHVADLMDKIRWDARCVQVKGYDSADRQKKLLPKKRSAAYREAADIIREDPRYVPQDSGQKLFDIAERLSSGAAVLSEDADFAAGIFARYCRLYLDMHGFCLYGGTP